MRLTVEEARMVGAEYLGINDKRWAFGLQRARDLEVRPPDMGPMILALALIGAHKMDDITEATLAAELTDAMALVTKAETAWRLQKAWRG